MSINLEGHSSSLRKWLSEGVILLIGPAIGYLVVYGFEIGYCWAFSVPSIFVRPDMVSAASVSVLLVIFSLIFWVPVKDTFATREFPVERMLEGQQLMGKWLYILVLFRRWLPVALLAFLVTVVLRVPIAWSRAALYFGVYALLDFAAIAFEPNQKMPLLSRLNNYPPLYLFPYSKVADAESRFGTTSLVAALTLTIGILVAGMLGNSIARHQEVFLVPASHPNSIVVRSYGVNYVCVELDQVTKQPTDRIIIVTSTDDKFSAFTKTNLGKILIPIKTLASPSEVTTNKVQATNQPASQRTNSP